MKLESNSRISCCYARTSCEVYECFRLKRLKRSTSFQFNFLHVCALENEPSLYLHSPQAAASIAIPTAVSSLIIVVNGKNTVTCGGSIGRVFSEIKSIATANNTRQSITAQCGWSTVPLQYVCKGLFTQDMIECLNSNAANNEYDDEMVTFKLYLCGPN